MANRARKTGPTYKRMPLLVVCVVLSFQSVPAHSMTLKEAANLAVKTYPDVQAAEEFGRALDQKLRQAWAGYLPRIDFTTGYGTETSDNATTRAVNTAAGRSQHSLTMNRGEATLIAKQNIFDGFDVRSKVAQAKAQLQAAQARLELTSDTVALLAVQTYVDVVQKHIQLEMIKDNVLLHQRIMSKVQKKFEGGAGTEADVNQAKSRTFLASANHASNQAGYKNAQAKFTEIIGTQPITEEEMIRPLIPEKMLPKSVDEALDAARLGNWELEAARLNVVAAEAGLEIAKAALYPKVDLELSSSNNANMGGSAGHGQATSAVVRMNYNLYGGGSDSAKIQEQRNMLEQARQLLEKTQRAVEETTRETWNKLSMARDRINFMQQHHAVSKRVTASYHDQFKMGKRTLLDVLNSENELFAARNGLLFEEHNYVKSAYELFNKMGKLREALDAEQPPTPEQRIQIEREANTRVLDPDPPKEEGQQEDAPSAPSKEERPEKDDSASMGAPQSSVALMQAQSKNVPSQDAKADDSFQSPLVVLPLEKETRSITSASAQMNATQNVASDPALQIMQNEGGTRKDSNAPLPSADISLQTIHAYQQIETYGPGQEPPARHARQTIKQDDAVQEPMVLHAYQQLESDQAIQKATYQAALDTAGSRR